MGRPSIFTQELADAICARLAEGESLLSICRDDAMPGRTTILRWCEDDETFRGKYARARDHGLDFRAEHCIEIADNESGDPQRDRLRFDARRWYLSKLAPKRYGDKLQHTDASGEGPVTVRWLTEADATSSSPTDPEASS